MLGGVDGLGRFGPHGLGRKRGPIVARVVEPRFDLSHKGSTVSTVTATRAVGSYRWSGEDSPGIEGCILTSTTVQMRTL